MYQFALHETVAIQLRKIGLPHLFGYRRPARRPQETRLAIFIVPALGVRYQDVVGLRLLDLAAAKQKDDE
jgi:hypothetical protein